MKFLFDLFPVILFFAMFKFQGIYVATITAIIASVLQIAWMLFRRKKVEPMMWTGLAIITVFGGATVLLHNEMFIKWKPTVLYWLLGTIMISGQLFFGKNAIKAMLGKQFSLPDATWKVMNFGWGIFFVALGCVNIFVAYHFSTDTWVNFKLFGIMGLIFCFAIAQGIFIEKKMKTEASREQKDQEPKEG
jgi:intracellular septation protein